MSPKPKSNLDRLAEVREKLKKTDLASGGGGGFWSPPVGRSIIRVLPEVGDMEFFFQPVGRHNMTPDGKQHVYCPEFTSEGELPCPVCELVEDLKKAGDAASKKLAGQMARRRAFWMNIIVRGKDGADTGPVIYTPGVSVMGSISSIIEDPDFGEVYDVDNGFDLVLERQGTGLDTEYEVRPRRNPSKLSNDPKQLEQWLEKARDLSFVEVSEDPEEDKELSANHAVYVLPYDRIVRDFDLDNLGDEDEDEEEIEEPAPRKAAPKKSKPVVEEVEEDDEEDEIEDDEEEDEEPPAKKEVTRRKMARRSSRR